MSVESLLRIEGKLDRLVTSVLDLKSTTAELAVGQAAFEHRFTRIEASVDRIQAEWGTVERRGVDAHARLDDHERRIAVLDDHERRIAALEHRQPDTDAR